MSSYYYNHAFAGPKGGETAYYCQNVLQSEGCHRRSRHHRRNSVVSTPTFYRPARMEVRYASETKAAPPPVAPPVRIWLDHPPEPPRWPEPAAPPLAPPTVTAPPPPACWLCGQGDWPDLQARRFQEMDILLCPDCQDHL